MRRHFRFFLLFSACTLGVPARAEVYPLAKALAPHMKPMGLTAKEEPAGLGQVRGQIIRILNAMQSSNEGGGPDGRGLVSKALEYQPEVGDSQRMMMKGNLMQMWQEARTLGCFNAENQFTGTITKGPEAGSQAVFEYIVQLEMAPRFSREISNVRLVAPSKSRAKGGADAVRDNAFVQQLRAVENEIEGRNKMKKFTDPPATNNLGETKEAVTKRFMEEMAKAGDAALKPPHLTLKGRLTEQPNKRNGSLWVYTVDLLNISPHPTELTVQWWLLGYTEIKHLNYLMAAGAEKVQLRALGATQLKFKTKANGHYDNRADDLDGLAPNDARRGKTETKYRGAVIRVIHGKDQVIATWASDASMAHCLEDEPDAEFDLYRLPKLFEDASK